MKRSYAVDIIESSRELTAKERISMKNTADCIRLDEATKDNTSVLIYPEFYAVLKVTNENSEDKEYLNYILADKDGNKYVTGSTTFWKSFMDIYNEMKNESEEWGIKVFRVDSKKYTGKQFITCSIV